LNNLKYFLSLFPRENPKELDQDKIIENLVQAKAPESHGAMGSANIDIFATSCVLSTSQCMCLENLVKIALC
jgi:hypothetical protein